ncbi:taurine ABC transporter permease [Levilactobacillus zymae]|uniref:Taurine ABC transporter permease n=1 Tax=Levilactobacillus zymae TaxID=267363 RepID=A0ABQ0WVK2_9LACO|nr:ABC transporter permease [Levilactobacillus zymae]KRL09539.1 taurine transport system permease protein tauC [Levilactobacillus zymae DSM 19395]QFR62243.1 ABC transporter permease subunit [Levilactobacillus zymae]GEO71909.1 taurine ABC transporter permease [Levilactobacillus zymae]
METKRPTKYRRLSLGVLLLILALWFGATAAHLVSGILLPSPQRVVTTFISLCQHGYNGVSLGTHYLVTMLRLIIAVVAAILIGVPLGLVSGYLLRVKAIVDPIIQFIRPIPPLAYYTLLILWLGIGESSKISLLFLAAIPPIYIACFDAVKKVNVEYLQSAASLGANAKQRFWHIVFPAAAPDIFTGVRSAVGVAYTTIVSAEMVASSTGIGWMIIDASHYLKSDVMFVGIIVLGVTGVALDWGIKALEHRLIKWSGRV